MQIKMHCVTIEDLVPKDHFLRKLDASVDFTFVYDMMQDLYCENNGRPSIDPVMIEKYLLLGYLYGIYSERRTQQEIDVNMAYKWFLGLDLDESAPDHSTISQNRRRRFNGKNLFRIMFEEVLRQCIEKGLVDGKVILTDSTHVKANASSKKNIRVLVERETTEYMERLERYEAAEREKLESEGKIKPKGPFRNNDDQSELVARTTSTTDPDAGFLQRPGKPQGMHYLDHQSIDAKNGIIVDVAVTPGNTNDVTPYLDRIEYMREKMCLPIEAVGVDSAYDVGLVHQELLENSIEVYTPKNEDKSTYKVEFTRDDFRYDQEADTLTCPAGNLLVLRRLQHGDYYVGRVYGSKSSDCNLCHLREKCLAPSQRSRRVYINIFEYAFRRSHDKDGTPEHKRVLDLRQVWCEGTFAAQKARHKLRNLYRRGLEAAEDHCLLSATAINLKRMVKCIG